MARNKNPTALFDAIHSAKKPPKASPSGSIPTPKWWGKNKPVVKTPVAPAVESSENVGKQKSWLAAARRNGTASSVTPPATVSVAMPVASVAEVSQDYLPPTTDQGSELQVELPPAVTEPVATKPRFIDRFVKDRSANRAPEMAPVVDEALADLPLTPASDEPTFIEPEIKPERKVSASRDDREPIIGVDRAAGDIRLRLSYAGLIAIAFIFVMALAIAFIVGTRAASQTALDDDSSSGQSGLTGQSSHLSLGNGSQPTSSKGGPVSSSQTSGMMAALGPVSPSDSSKNQDIKPDVLLVPPHPSRNTDARTSAKGPAALPIKSTRDIGMMYVVVQSYPEQDLAQKACDYMNQSGVQCTLVQGPSNWAPRDWYSVIGLQPFNKHDAGLAEYEKSIRQLGAKFTSRVIDQFQPQAYTWREDSDLSQP